MKAEIIFQDGNWIGMAAGKKVVKSYDQTRVVKMMAKAGYKNVPIRGEDVTTAVEDAECQWDINQRFSFLTDLVTMVAKRQAVSVVVTGPGGLGKTHTVQAALKAAGLKDASDMNSFGKDGLYRVIKGYSTAKGLFRELYENRDSVIVFDDCDAVLKDPVALNLLKGALDSYDKRVISWNADFRDEDLERSFQFTGRVIFISNIKRENLDAALLTRAYCVDLRMTDAQKLERMSVLTESEDFLPQFDIKHKREALALIGEVGDRAREISLRTLQAVTRIRAANTKNWRALAEYTLTN
jgi:hypothetical protein